MSSNWIGDLVYETFYSLGGNKKNDFVGMLLLASPEKLIKKRNVINDKIDWLQMQINNIKDSQCALKENLLSSNHRAAGNQTKALIIRLDELQ